MPDFKLVLTMAPIELPYSAGAFVVMSLNSWIASTFGREASSIVLTLVGIHPVEPVIVCLRPITVDERLAARSAGKRPHAVGDDAGGKQCELGEVAAVEGEIRGGVTRNDMPQLGVLGLEKRRKVVDFDGLGGGADFQREVQAGALIDFESDRVREKPLEAGRLYRQGVGAGRQTCDVVDARLIW